MSAVELATGYVSIVPSARGIVGSLTKELSPIEGIAASAGQKSGAAMNKGIAGQLGGFAKSALPIAAIGGLALGAAESVENARNTIVRATGASGKAADGLVKSFQNVAKSSPASFGVIASTLAEVSQRTGLVGPPLENLTKQVVTFNRITKDSPIGVQDLTKSLAGFNVPAAGTSGALDRLFTISQKTGVPLNDLVTTLGSAGPILRQFKLPLDQSASLLGKLDKAGVDSSATIGGLKKAFTTFAKAGLDPKKALENVLAKIGELVKSGDKVGAQQLGVKIFGARGVGIVDAAIAGKLSISDLTKTVNASGPGILKTASATSTLGGKLGILKNQAQLALAQIGGPALDFATKSLTSLMPVITTVIGGFGKLPGPVRNSALGFVALAAAVGPIRKIGGILTSNVKAIANAGKGIGTAVKGIASGVSTASSKVAGFFKAGGGSDTLRLRFGQVGTAAKSAIAQIGKGISTVASFAKSALLGAANIAKQTVAFIAQKAAALAAAVAQKAMAAAQWLLNTAMDANPVALLVIGIAALVAGVVLAYQHFGPFRAVVDAVGRAFATVARVVTGAVVGAFNWIKSHWPLLFAILGGPVGLAALFIKTHWAQITGIFTATFGWIKRNWPLLLAILTGPIGLAVLVISRNWTTIKNGVGTVFSAIRNAFNKVVTFVAGLPGRIGSAAKGLFDGVKNAFKDAVDFIIDGWNNLQFKIGGGSIFGKHLPSLTLDTPNIPRLAGGGVATSPLLALLGETSRARPEIAAPAALLHNIFRSDLDRFAQLHSPKRPADVVPARAVASGGAVKVDQHITMRQDVLSKSDLDYANAHLAWKLRNTGRRA